MRQKLFDSNSRKVDAVTNEKLGDKVIAIPVGNSGEFLSYNTSTLIQIAEVYGEFMQPPYFRERATDSLIEQISTIEGRPITITKKHRDSESRGNSTGVHHAMEGFADFMNAHHEPLSSKNLYYCPVCYDEILDDVVKDQSAMQSGSTRDSEDFQDQRDIRETIDPLVVLRSLESKKILNRVVYLKAKDWKAHVFKFHYVPPVDKHQESLKSHTFFTRFQILPSDFTVRTKINSFISNFNHELGAKELYHRIHENTRLYWHNCQHFSVYSYNRILDSVMLSEPDLENSVCLGDEKMILGNPDDALDTSDEDENSIDEASHADPRGQRHQAESADLERKELHEIAKYFQKRAKREHYNLSDECDSTCTYDSSSSRTSLESTSVSDADSSDYGPMSTVFGRKRQKMTQHERQEMSKMALKEEIQQEKPVYTGTMENRKIEFATDKPPISSDTDSFAINTILQEPNENKISTKGSQMLLYDSE